MNMRLFIKLDSGCLVNVNAISFIDPESRQVYTMDGDACAVNCTENDMKLIMEQIEVIGGKFID